MLPTLLAAATDSSGWQVFWQHCLNGLASGALFALIALGYTMVYGIIGLINFAHGDLFMLGAFLALSMVGWLGLSTASSAGALTGGLLLILLVVPLFCAVLNVAVDRIVYKPLRKAPKLAPLVSAIGVSFIFMNVGLLWKGAASLDFPNLIPRTNLIGSADAAGAGMHFTLQDALLFAVVIPIMIGLTVLVKFTNLGKAMRATAQNPVAAQLMGINVERVIAATFAIGGALGGMASVVFGLYINSVNYQMGYINGLYAFTAAVLGGIGNIPGAVLGGLIIGLVHSLGSGYIGERWSSALIFAILIGILIFRPSGLLGATAREKV